MSGFCSDHSLILDQHERRAQCINLWTYSPPPAPPAAATVTNTATTSAPTTTMPPTPPTLPHRRLLLLLQLLLLLPSTRYRIPFQLANGRCPLAAEMNDLSFSLFCQGLVLILLSCCSSGCCFHSLRGLKVASWKHRVVELHARSCVAQISTRLLDEAVLVDVKKGHDDEDLEVRGLLR